MRKDLNWFISAFLQDGHYFNNDATTNRIILDIVSKAALVERLAKSGDPHQDAILGWLDQCLEAWNASFLSQHQYTVCAKFHNYLNHQALANSL